MEECIIHHDVILFSFYFSAFFFIMVEYLMVNKKKNYKCFVYSLWPMRQYTMDYNSEIMIFPFNPNSLSLT